MGYKDTTRYDLRPIRDTNESEWAWAAGVYEGEGSIDINGRGKSARVQIPQKDPHILRKLQQFCGGSVKQTARGSSGCPAWRLSFSGALAERFVNRTWKWLSPRRQDQIVRVLPTLECS